MKTITKLTGESTDATLHAPRAVTQAVHIEPSPGFFLRAELGSFGVAVRDNAGHRVEISLEELLRFAQTHEPALIPPTKPPLELQARAYVKAKQLAATSNTTPSKPPQRGTHTK